MGDWNLGDVLEVVASEVPDAPALIQGHRVLIWRDLDRRASAVAAYLAGKGIPRQARVAQYLNNAPEYLESAVACFKGSFVPMNTNYRYGVDELAYLWDNADTAAVVFHGSYTPKVEAVRSSHPQAVLWLWVDDGSFPCPSWAVAYDDVAEARLGAYPPPPWSRSGDDVIQLYTGGTTGMPKGVMWRQDDLFIRLNTERGDDYPELYDAAFVRAKVARKGRAHLPAGPLMHGAGLLTCFLTLSRGAPISHTLNRSFDPVDLLETIQRDRVASVMWVGDAFARPTLAALEAEPERWDLSSLRVIMSSGVIFSPDVKQALLRFMPKVVISDVFGSSETMSLGRSVTSAGERPGQPGAFQIKPTVRVVNESDADVVPGSGERGLLAIGGRQPIGYYKDDAKTAATFRIIDGVRYVIPGDWATVDPHGMVTLIGRGSECINTGGEKVFPEEVEQVLKRHDAVYDAVVVGIPDNRFGQRIVAVAQPEPGRMIDEGALIGFVKQHIAGYKAPRRIVAVAKVDRGPNGKPDLKAIRELCIASETEVAS